MNRSSSHPAPVLGPLTLDWTIARLLEWIGEDDGRCHDERLAEILDAVERRLGLVPARRTGRVVVRVRALALRLAAESEVREWTLGDLTGDAEERVASGGVLVPA